MTTSQKHLGAILVYGLNFDSHLNSPISKTTKIIGPPRKLKNT